FPSSTLDSSQLLQNEDTVAQETVQRDENEQKVLEQELLKQEQIELESTTQEATQSIFLIDTSRVQLNKLPASDDMDSEILEIFLEEAREVEIELKQSFNQWKADHTDSEALTAVRRVFHTLKGSGRMAGAMEIGECAWAIENLLNRVIDETISVSEELFDFLQQIIDILPNLIDAQEKGFKPPVNLEKVQEHADAFLNKPLPIPSSIPQQTNTEEKNIEIRDVDVDTSHLESVDSIGFSSVFDDLELRSIFESEANKHLTTLNNFINGCAKGPAPWIFNEELSRALHTLAGSAHMAGMTSVATLAKALEHKAMYILNQESGADDNFLALLKESAEIIQNAINMLDQGEAVMPDTRKMIERVEKYTLDDFTSNPGMSSASTLDNFGDFDINIDGNTDWNQNQELGNSCSKTFCSFSSRCTVSCATVSSFCNNWEESKVDDGK
ncbi:hypothetical protein TI03_05235, partial [Achromatium sp. WMS1]